MRGAIPRHHPANFGRKVAYSITFLPKFSTARGSAAPTAIHRRLRDLASTDAGCDHREMPRFLTLADVCEILNVSSAQAYALVRSGELPAIQVGGRSQWRIEEQRLEDYISAKYAEAQARAEFSNQH